MHVVVQINSIGKWETALHPETDLPMDDPDATEMPSEEMLLAVKRHNFVNRRRVRVVVDGVPVVENRPGTKHFNLGTEPGAVQIPHGVVAHRLAPAPAAEEPAPVIEDQETLAPAAG